MVTVEGRRPRDENNQPDNKMNTMTNDQKHAHLQRIATSLNESIAAHVAVCEYSCEDSTPTLHIDLWRGYDMCDLSQEVNALEIASEGFWDGGRCYSLQLAK